MILGLNMKARKILINSQKNSSRDEISENEDEKKAAF